MGIYKIVLMVSVVCIFRLIYIYEAFATKRIIGDFVVSNKSESDTLRDTLVALSPITEPRLLEVKQKTETKDSKTTEQVSIDIVFKQGSDLEADVYFTEMKKQNQNAKISIHECKNSEHTGQPNISCVLDEEVILTKP